MTLLIGSGGAACSVPSLLKPGVQTGTGVRHSCALQMGSAGASESADARNAIRHNTVANAQAAADRCLTTKRYPRLRQSFLAPHFARDFVLYLFKYVWHYPRRGCTTSPAKARVLDRGARDRRGDRPRGRARPIRDRRSGPPASAAQSSYPRRLNCRVMRCSSRRANVLAPKIEAIMAFRFSDAASRPIGRSLAGTKLEIGSDRGISLSIASS